MLMINVSMIEKSSNSDTMSRRSQRGVTFCEDIEMDSLEPENSVVYGRNGLLPIQENDIEFLIASVDAFEEFDVSWNIFEI